MKINRVGQKTKKPMLETVPLTKKFDANVKKKFLKKKKTFKSLSFK
jgi:hypothetical protein